MKKRVLSTLLAFCMVLSLLPGTALADFLSNHSIGDLEGVTESDGVYTLNQKIDITTYIEIKQDTTVNLAGFSLTRVEGSGQVFYVDGATLTIKGSGTITGTAGGNTIVVNGENGKLVIEEDSTVTITQATGATVSVIQLQNDASAEINGGGIVGKPASGDNHASVQVGTATADKKPGTKGSLTITGGVISGSSCGILVCGSESSLAVSGNPRISGTDFGISTNGATTGADAEIKVSGGTITGGNDATGIYLPAGSLTVSGDAKISGGAGIVVRGGTLEVKGGTIEATSSSNVEVGDAKKDGKTYKIPPAGIVVDENTAYTINNVTINGGEVKAAAGQSAVTYTEDGKAPTTKTPPITITGGTFSSSVSEYVKSDYKFEAKSSDGYTYHSTAESAQKAAGSSGTYKDLSTDGKTYYPIKVTSAAEDWGTYVIKVGESEKDFAAAGETVTVTVTPKATGASAALSVDDAAANSSATTGENTITFTMPAKAVTVTVTFKNSDGKEDPEQPKAGVHTITFDANGGKLAGSETAETGENGRLSNLPANPARDGYVFDGWYTKATGGTRVSTQTVFTEDTTVYAHWIKGDYRITLNAYPSRGGRVTGGGYYDKGEFVTVSAYPAKGYDFDCWEDEDGYLVSTSLDYTFKASEDIVLTAIFVADNYNSGLTYQVNIAGTANGSVTSNSPTARSGQKITITARPNSGYTVGDVVVVDSKGNAIPTTNNGGGSYTFTMPASRAVVSVIFNAAIVGTTTPSNGAFNQTGGGTSPAVTAHGTPWVSPMAYVSYGTPWASPYRDVTEKDWFYQDVSYMVRGGLMNGVGSQTFDPNGTTTKGMVMTMLARMCGVDTSTSIPWYRVGVSWAMRSDVSNGEDPEGNITREELAVMLWRCVGRPEAAGSLSAWSDARDVHDWAGSAMLWAVQKGIINGSNGRLNPQGNATRSEVAAMLTRFCRNVGI